jgi:hypothetical protein
VKESAFLDPANVPSLWQALKGCFNPGAWYDYTDQSMQDLTVFLAENYGLGMGGGIIAVSLLIKIVFTPFQIKA